MVSHGKGKGLYFSYPPQIPDVGLHLTRYYGAFANKLRQQRLPHKPDLPMPPLDDHEDDPPFINARRASWARLLLHVLEVQALVCPRCGGLMRVVSIITDPAIVDRVLRHCRDHNIVSAFEARPPPEADLRASTTLPDDVA